MFASLCICMGTIHLYGKNVENFKPLPVLLKFHVEPPEVGGTIDCLNGHGPLTKMAAMPIYGKNLKKSSPDPRMPWGWIFAQIIGDERSTKVAKIIVVHWPFYGKVKFASLCICMGTIHLYGKTVENFKWLLLWSLLANVAQISCGASLGWGNEKLLKWSQSIDQDGCHAHIW